MKSIIEAIKAIWNILKKIFVKVLNFLIHIVDWFKKKLWKYKEKLEKGEIISVIAKVEDTIKKDLEKGNYKVVKCFYNIKTGKIENYEEDAEIVEAEKLDKQTRELFKDTSVVILK